MALVHDDDAVCVADCREAMGYNKDSSAKESIDIRTIGRSISKIKNSSYIQLKTLLKDEVVEAE